MSKKVLISLISELLKERFTVGSLKAIRSMLNSGMLSDVFSDAVDRSIESKVADEWQQENQINV